MVEDGRVKFRGKEPGILIGSFLEYILTTAPVPHRNTDAAVLSSHWLGEYQPPRAICTKPPPPTFKVGIQKEAVPVR